MKTIQTLLLALLIFINPFFAEASPVLSDKEPHPASIKILGGVESKTGDWPWITALLISSEPDMYQAQFCAGVLIGQSWVLTAAHCVENQSPSQIAVAVGAYDLNNYSGPRTPVKSIRVHPRYSSTSFQNDIALIELGQPSFQPTISLFSGESKEEVPPSMIGEMTTAIGWGLADASSYWYFPEKLRQVNLPVVSNSYCNNIYATILTSSQICAGYYEAKDVCNGDSGGPIVSKIDGRWIHVGLVSYGKTCRSYFGRYGVYTRTSTYIDFIKQYVPDVSIHTANSDLSWLLLLLSD
jgi:secreted trypsin-like serine protease